MGQDDNNSKSARQAAILYKTLFIKASSPDPNNMFASGILKSILPLEVGIIVNLKTDLKLIDYNSIIESLKLYIMQDNSNQANRICRILAKVYEIGFHVEKNEYNAGCHVEKDEYSAMLLTLIGCKLGNRECQQLVEADLAKYEILKHTADNFIYNYVGRSDITFDNAILSAASIPDTLETQALGNENYTANYNMY